MCRVPWVPVTCVAQVLSCVSASVARACAVPAVCDVRRPAAFRVAAFCLTAVCHCGSPCVDILCLGMCCVVLGACDVCRPSGSPCVDTPACGRVSSPVLASCVDQAACCVEVSNFKTCVIHGICHVCRPAGPASVSIVPYGRVSSMRIGVHQHACLTYVLL